MKKMMAIVCAAAALVSAGGAGVANAASRVSAGVVGATIGSSHSAERVHIFRGELSRPPHIIIPQSVQRLLRDDPDAGRGEFVRQFCEDYPCRSDTDRAMAQMFAARASSIVEPRGICPKATPNLWINFAREEEGCMKRGALVAL